MKQTAEIAIVGGGIMGMTLAYRLSQIGYKVILLESSKELGGLTTAWKIGAFNWDRFYHVILPDDIYTISILRDIGLADKINWQETKTGFYLNKKYYSLSNTWEFLTFPPLNIFNKIRLALTILVGSYQRNWDKLEQIPVEQWLLKWSGKRTYYKIWLPLLKAKLGNDYTRTSAAFICTTIQRLYKARKKGSKKEVFGYVSGGYANILESFKNKLVEEGIDTRTDFTVKEIANLKSQDIELISTDNQKIRAKKVIVTLPSVTTSKIKSDLSKAEIEKLKAVSYLGNISVSLISRRQLTPYYVTNIADINTPFTGVIEMTALVDKSHFEGNSLVYLSKYANANDPIFSLSDEEIKNSFLNYLFEMQPSLADEDIIASKVARARQVIALPVLEYSKKLHRVSTSVEGLFIINSALISDGTLNVNETVKIAESKLKWLLDNNLLKT